MACGIPALAHRACGNAEVIEHLANGFLGNLSGPDALRSALIDVLHNRATLPSLGRAACVTIQSKFSLAAMVGGYERLYREVAVSHAG
jgi:glycosyltransferase involved in cell wall biosynthesis